MKKYNLLFLFIFIFLFLSACDSGNKNKYYNYFKVNRGEYSFLSTYREINLGKDITDSNFFEDDFFTYTSKENGKNLYCNVYDVKKEKLIIKGNSNFERVFCSDESNIIYITHFDESSSVYDTNGKHLFSLDVKSYNYTSKNDFFNINSTIYNYNKKIIEIDEIISDIYYYNEIILIRTSEHDRYYDKNGKLFYETERDNDLFIPITLKKGLRVDHARVSESDDYDYFLYDGTYIKQTIEIIDYKSKKITSIKNFDYALDRFYTPLTYPEEAPNLINERKLNSILATGHLINKDKSLANDSILFLNQNFKIEKAFESFDNIHPLSNGNTLIYKSFSESSLIDKNGKVLKIFSRPNFHSYSQLIEENHTYYNMNGKIILDNSNKDTIEYGLSGNYGAYYDFDKKELCFFTNKGNIIKTLKVAKEMIYLNMYTKLLEITNGDKIDFVNFRGTTVFSLSKDIYRYTYFGSASSSNPVTFYTYRYEENDFILMIIKT